MMDYASRDLGFSIADAYVEASATASLSERDKDIMLEPFSERTEGEE
jgi:hypothetical protein